MGKVFGYKRVSSVDQRFDRQDLGDGVDQVFEEKLSGKNRERPALADMLRFLREGDEVRVHSIDRLGRSMSDLLAIIADITGKGAKVNFLSEGLKFGPSGASMYDELQLHLLSAFAQFERRLTERRRLEGIEKAKAAGRYKTGRPRAMIDLDKIRKLREDGLSIRQIAVHVGAHRSTVHRIIQSYE
jgi:DNA invertase Pin-like site-specific DNA recombinase